MKVVLCGLFLSIFAGAFAGDACSPSSDFGCSVSVADSGIYGTLSQTLTFPQLSTTIESVTLYVHRNDLSTATTVTLHVSISFDLGGHTDSTMPYTAPGLITFPLTGISATDGDTVALTILEASDFSVAMETSDVCLGASGSSKRSGQDFLYSMVLSCGSGSSGDPHFYGFKGQKYDVMGQSFEIYNVISAPYLQINSQFTPYFKTATQTIPTGTMIGTLGIQFNGHKFFINSNSTVGQLNGQDVAMNSDWKVTFGDLVLSNHANGRMYEISFQSQDILITFVRKVYKVYGLEDQWHLDYKARTYTENTEFHGLLGQTWDTKVFEDKEGAFKYLDGEEDDYRIKSNQIFGTDFKYNKYQSL